MNSLKLIVVAICLVVMSFAISTTAQPTKSLEANKLGKEVFEHSCASAVSATLEPS